MEENCLTLGQFENQGVNSRNQDEEFHEEMKRHHWKVASESFRGRAKKSGRKVWPEQVIEDLEESPVTGRGGGHLEVRRKRWEVGGRMKVPLLQSINTDVIFVLLEGKGKG